MYISYKIPDGAETKWEITTMRPGVILFMFFAVASSFAKAPAFEQQLEPYTVAEAYEVYSVVLPEEFKGSAARNLVIEQETNGIEMCLKPEADSDPGLIEASLDYVDQNRKARLLQWDFQIDTPYELVPRAVLSRFFDGNGSGWDGFYKAYPDSAGTTFLSAVGFNKDRTIAVLSVGNSCGGLCGGGDFKVLEKRDGAWKPLVWKGSRCMWAA